MNNLIKTLKNIMLVGLTSVSMSNVHAAMGMLILPPTSPQQANPYAGVVDNTLQTMMMVEQIKAQELQNQQLYAKKLIKHSQ
jgi:hypothetical protein